MSPKSAMHVDVSDILRRGEGSQTDFLIEDESPNLEGLTLASPINGSLRVVGMKDGVVTAGTFSLDLTLECNRCLRAFTSHLEVPLNAEFNDAPDEDQFPIDSRGRIDLAEPLRQEIEVRLPLAPLCQEDCGGIELKHKT